MFSLQTEAGRICFVEVDISLKSAGALPVVMGGAANQVPPIVVGGGTMTCTFTTGCE